MTPQGDTSHSCYLHMNFIQAMYVDSSVRKPGREALSSSAKMSLSTHTSGCAQLPLGPLKPDTYPVEGFMMQPPFSAAILQLQPLSSVSWFIPKLWPSSCAKVTAAPRGLSEWSSKRI